MKTKIYRVYAHEDEGYVGCVAFYYNKENAIKRLRKADKENSDEFVTFGIDEYYIEDEKEECDGLDCSWCTNPNCPKEK